MNTVCSSGVVFPGFYFCLLSTLFCTLCSFSLCVDAVVFQQWRGVCYDWSYGAVYSISLWSVFSGLLYLISMLFIGPVRLYFRYTIQILTFCLSRLSSRTYLLGIGLRLEKRIASIMLLLIFSFHSVAYLLTISRYFCRCFAKN